MAAVSLGLDLLYFIQAWSWQPASPIVSVHVAVALRLVPRTEAVLVGPVFGQRLADLAAKLVFRPSFRKISLR